MVRARLGENNTRLTDNPEYMKNYMKAYYQKNFAENQGKMREIWIEINTILSRKNRTVQPTITNLIITLQKLGQI